VKYNHLASKGIFAALMDI